MPALATIMLFMCGASVIFVLGAMTGRAFAVWGQADGEAVLRAEITRLGNAVIAGKSGLKPSDSDEPR